jgi:uncharacterized membrane protein YccC
LQAGHIPKLTLGLRSAVEGLFASLAGWRTLAARLARSSGNVVRTEAEFMLDRLPAELRLVLRHDDPGQWRSNPLELRRLCAASIDALVTLQASTASLRLLAEQTIAMLAGVSRVLDGLASLSGDHAARPVRPLHRKLHVTDWLPPFVNAGRTFVTIVAAEGFWIISAWPNGAGAVAWAAIVVLLFAPKADGAHVDSLGFTIGISLAAVCAAVIAFAVLPNVETFVGFDLMMGLYLVPAGSLMALTWPAATLAAMAGTFVQLLSPTNQMDLRSHAILQHGIRDHRGVRRRGIVVPPAPAIVAGLSGSANAGINIARSSWPLLRQSWEAVIVRLGRAVVPPA